jgi:hypothetical protein
LNFFRNQHVVKTSQFPTIIIIRTIEITSAIGNGMDFESMNRGELQQPPEKSAVRSIARFTEITALKTDGAQFSPEFSY